MLKLLNKKMIKIYDLLIDVGNTNIHIGFVSGANKKIYKITTINVTCNTNYNKAGRDIRRAIGSRKIEAAYICSVCPSTLSVIVKILKALKIKINILGRDIKLQIKNKYKNPLQVGTDRLVNAIAVAGEYKLPAIIIDFGTAVTIDSVSKNKEYLGGCILAGLRMSAKALHRQTALLPDVNIRPVKKYFGRTTEESIISGIVWGYAGASMTIVNNLKKTLRSEPVIVTTGGDSKLMKNFFPKNYIIDTALTLKGINIARLSFLRCSEV